MLKRRGKAQNKYSFEPDQHSMTTVWIMKEQKAP